ncbi:hypothetical protein BKA64DRAFT_687406 [Cadophora sp. MPI-SDFR-AT-0126]|nr:hypothetical protein BKA64DRAFT_687406 [Leotiomycetes sp. MPI-SDFR-AT-0126]
MHTNTDTHTHTHTHTHTLRPFPSHYTSTIMAKWHAATRRRGSLRRFNPNRRAQFLVSESSPEPSSPSMVSDTEWPPLMEDTSSNRLDHGAAPLSHDGNHTRDDDGVTAGHASTPGSPATQSPGSLDGHPFEGSELGDTSERAALLDVAPDSSLLVAVTERLGAGSSSSPTFIYNSDEVRIIRASSVMAARGKMEAVVKVLAAQLTEKHDATLKRSFAEFHRDSVNSITELIHSAQFEFCMYKGLVQAFKSE